MKNKLLYFIPLFVILCGCSNDNKAIIEEKETIKEVTSEVLLFDFTHDTGNNSWRLQYEIKYTNPNNFAIRGYSSITMDFSGLILTPIKRVPPYIEIGANSSYIEIYNVETPYDTNAQTPEQIKAFYVKFVSVKFKIVE